ncbi:MAG: malto-oligosyltrehalose synthase [Alphaproteobacteria bacterium]|nr:malto-oligosyltrehalose synthase [Alphaproteobacteria bacterium]
MSEEQAQGVRATYRLQFHKGFTFADAAPLAPYFASLGISHVYASPILVARAGSTHGYDVLDHGRVNPELGGDGGFRDLVAALRACGLGVIIEVVPNHMAVAGVRNIWWQDVLARGARSKYADYFDIDWRAPGLEGKILVPFLGAPALDVLGGDLKVEFDPELETFAFRYFNHRFPLRPEDQAAMRRRDPRTLGFVELESLLAHQHYVLADWHEADYRINWRRFFTITDLAALRVERPDVFEAVHAKTFELFRNGLIDGIRVDHIDGLADPRAYCRALHDRLTQLVGNRPANLRGFLVVVEKILATGESLPQDWPIDGTTGYDFMNDVSAVQHAPDQMEILDRLWRRYGGRGAVFEREERAARRQVLAASFAAQLAATARAFAAASRRTLSRRAWRQAVGATVREMRSYRTYSTGKDDSPSPGPHFSRATERATELNPSHAEAIAAVAAVMNDHGGDHATIEAVRRFNQLCASVAAKAVEDTALYRYGRLLSRNDVGFDPRLATISVDAFHLQAERRSAALPNSLLATATHDHKRGEDARARLAVLSEIPAVWRKTVTGWFSMNAPLRPPDLRHADEYQLYQTLIGVWPAGGASSSEFAALPERLRRWASKHLREAKLRSRWRSPNEAYEEGFQAFTQMLLTARRCQSFRTGVDDFVRHITPAAAVNGLVQCALRCTLPGIPDLYQGREFEDLSLVDPDNRRSVDFDMRRQVLESTCDGNNSYSHRKLHLIAALLRARSRHARLFSDGTYRRLPTCGDRKDHLIAFERRLADRTFVIVVGCRLAGPLCGGRTLVPSFAWWADTHVEMGDWTAPEAIIGNPAVRGATIRAAELFETVPVYAAVHRRHHNHEYA